MGFGASRHQVSGDRGGLQSSGSLSRNPTLRLGRKTRQISFQGARIPNDASSLLNSPTFTTDELNVEQRTRMHAMANKTCERHTRKVLNRLWARKLASRYPLPYAVFLPLMAIARNPAVRNFVSKSSLWSSLRQRTLDNAA